MLKKASKRFKKLIEKSINLKPNNIVEAIKVVKENCTIKFDESIDVSFKLNLKQKKEEVNVRIPVNLPNGNGKKIKVAVLCEESKIQEAKDGGADIYDSESLINDINAGKFNFDKLVATPAMMPKMGKLGKILGPKGLMPNPKLGTVATDIKKAVQDIKTGLVEIKNDKDGNVSSTIGRKSFSNEKLINNYNFLIDSIKKEKPDLMKTELVKNIYITSTMGISYKVGGKN